MLYHFTIWEVSNWITRPLNNVAHLFACLAQYISPETRWDAFPPAFLISTLHEDKLFNKNSMPCDFIKN